MLHREPFIEPCVPTLAKEPPIGPHWIHEVKFDGYRVQIHKDRDNVRLFSKNGNDFATRFPVITYVVRRLPTTSFIVDAELTACKHDGSPDFSALLSRKGEDLCVWAFDLLSQYGRSLRPLDLRIRREKLQKLIARVDTPRLRFSEPFADPHALLKVCADLKMEGVVSKRLDRPYRSGRTKDWIKVKCAGWREHNRWRHEFFAQR